MVDALFIDPKGIYPKLLGPEHCWDEKRDALMYRGAGPVVAHPPCNLWVNMAAVNWKRYGRQKPAWQGGSDGGCFVAAASAVVRLGGVLEHPAGSHAWAHFGLMRPDRTLLGEKRGTGWHHAAVPGTWPQQLCWVCEVWQHAYGHGARKATWLIYCGKRPPFELNWERNSATVTHYCGHDAKWRTTKKRLEKRHASATPEPFARELIRLAEWSRG